MGMKGHENEAVRNLEHAIELDPNRAEFWVILAEFMAHEDGSVVAALLRKGLSHNPDSPDLRYDLISLNEESAGEAATIKAFESLVEKHPEHYASLIRLGSLLATRSETRKRAGELLQQASVINQHGVMLVSAQAWLEHHSGNSETALETLSAVARQHADPLTLYRIAVIHSENGRREVARSTANAALAGGLSGLERAHAAELAR